MPVAPLLLTLAIVLVGMALALSQFCMVRAVLGVRDGEVSAARCVLAISLAIAVCLQLLAAISDGETMPTYTPEPLQVLLGGGLFGIAARANGGCYIGTINDLCRGQWRRLFSVTGWVIGFALLQRPPLPAHNQNGLELGLVLSGLALLLTALNHWARTREQGFQPNPAIGWLQGRRAWALMLSSGILMGLLHHTDLPWHPSSLARALGRFLAGTPLPPATACALLIPLGMVLVHRWLGVQQTRAPAWGDLSLLVWGTLMGLATVWGMGANDGYLFRSLPLGSLHAASGLAAMTAGILLPLRWPGALAGHAAASLAISRNETRNGPRQRQGGPDSADGWQGR
ncbi:MAG: YeeE/YedE thiosulfate transporter family protein [Cyanobacteriota bacterium]|nr:YeeE/YedE thiosulfate transporter family protein [Cyanobacteriota bacterium]